MDIERKGMNKNMESLNKLLSSNNNLINVAKKWFFKFNTKVLTGEEYSEYKNDIKSNNLETKDVHDYMCWFYIEYLEKILEENNINYKERIDMDDNKKLELKEKLGSIVEELLAKLRKHVDEALDQDIFAEDIESEEKVENNVKTTEKIYDEVCPSYDEEEDEYYVDVNDEELQELIEHLQAEGIPFKLLTQEDFDKMQEEEEKDEEKLVDLFYMIENDDKPSVKLTEEEIEYIEEIADEIEPIHLGRVFPCVVNGEDRYLTDGLNCNLVDIPLLGVTLISPVNIKVDVLYIDPNAESLDDIKILVTMPRGENIGYGCETTIGILRKVGLLELVATFDLEIDLTALAFRGITKKADEEEFEELIKLSEGVDNNGILN